jgi:hypothetical protein
MLGFAIQIANGTLTSSALLLVTVTFAMAALAGSNFKLGVVERYGEPLVVGLLALLLAYQFYLLEANPPGVYLRATDAQVSMFVGALGAAALLAGVAIADDGPLGRLAMPLVLLAHFLLGIWLVQVGRIVIDVDTFHRMGIKALAEGHSPYSVVFPDVYYGRGSERFYGEGLAVNGFLTFGFPYPPLSILMSAPGELLFGDFRYSHLFAITASGGLIAYARPGRIARVAACLLLFTPRVFYVLQTGWTEPLLLLLLSATAFCACRGFHRPLPYLVGLLLASKQYMVLLAPLFLFLLDRPLDRRQVLRFAAKAAGTALAITVPFFLWDPAGFLRSVVVVQFKQPFRPDALSYLAWLLPNRTQLPPGLGLLSLFAAVGLAVWGYFRAPRSPAGMCAGLAAGLMGLFALSKQAFCNYYFLVLGVLCIALGMMARPALAQVSLKGAKPAKS